MELTVRPLDEASGAEITWVATRMRRTLQEVLGVERGTAMYDLAWLHGRVREHLGRPDAAVFLAVRGGEVAGHTIVREESDGEPLALVSTTWVEPGERRRGVAACLLERAEAWAQERGLRRIATHTAADNGPLIELYERRGYVIDLRDGEMVRLLRDSTDA